MNAKLVEVALVAKRFVVEAVPTMFRLVVVAKLAKKLEVDAFVAAKLLVAVAFKNDTLPVNVAVLPKMLATVSPVVEAFVDDANTEKKLVDVPFTVRKLVVEANAA